MSHQDGVQTPLWDALNELFDFASDFAVALERYALDARFGVDGRSNELAMFVDEVGTAVGPGAAAFLDRAVLDLIDALGDSLLPDTGLLVDPALGIDVADGAAGHLRVDVPEGPYILYVGSLDRVGDGELASIARGAVDGDGDDSDVEQLLREMIDGRSQANLEREFEPGIDGVELIGLTRASYTLAIEDGDATDVIRFEGPGTAAAIAALDRPADLADLRSSLSLVEFGVDPIEIGRWLNPIRDVVGRRFDSDADLAAVLDAARAGTDERICRIGEADDSFAVRIENPFLRTVDTLVFHGDAVEDLLDGGDGAPGVFIA